MFDFFRKFGNEADTSASARWFTLHEATGISCQRNCALNNFDMHQFPQTLVVNGEDQVITTCAHPKAPLRHTTEGRNNPYEGFDSGQLRVCMIIHPDFDISTDIKTNP